MTVSEQFVSILIMIISGILVGAVIDCLRVTIGALSPKSFLKRFTIGLELVIWALLGALTFYILYIIKGGEWRLIDPIAQISGILLYESLFQPFFRFLGKIVLFVVVRPILIFFKLIFSIFRRIILIIMSIILFILSPFRKLFTKWYSKVYSKFGKSIFKKG
ncbi:spore cortex biosynthesis protein YabQ [Ureibacillus manganicus]|uniref:spore cortex biosynthesis protein YabQ n=1 Tax=Ureibacillus manganicus TaxID=1266064 RepID=UPI00068F1FD1|nr:spore cortex biosynthesis protein YabQ [Ureibacillus manganicus]